jgi:protein TonB
MNIQRYILPGTLAAVFHAALLLGLPGKTMREMVTVIEVPLVPPPRPPDDPITLPPEEKPVVGPVRPLAGGPTAPELEPVPIPLKPEMPIAEERRVFNPSPDVRVISELRGLGNIALPGVRGDTTPIISLAGQLDNAPRAKVQPSPDYPARMQQAGISGTVTVEFDVNTAGQVVRAEAARYSHREFVEPALRAVRHWRFEPGRRDGRVVPFRMCVPIEFGIERG